MLSHVPSNDRPHKPYILECFLPKVLSTLSYLLSTPNGPLCKHINKAFSLPSVASLACVWACLAMDLVRGPRRSSSMDSLPPSRPRRSPSRPRRSPSRPRRSPWSWSWSRRFPWLPWVGVLGPPPSMCHTKTYFYTLIFWIQVGFY